MDKRAFALWKGPIQKGQGWISTLSSETLEAIPYSFATRFENRDEGTNPEELIAAAHASCFAMAFSGNLTKAGFEVRAIKATAHVSIDRVNGDWTITSSKLNVEGDIPGINESKFQ